MHIAIAEHDVLMTRNVFFKYFEMPGQEMLIFICYECEESSSKIHLIVD